MSSTTLLSQIPPASPKQAIIAACTADSQNLKSSAESLPITATNVPSQTFSVPTVHTGNKSRRKKLSDDNVSPEPQPPHLQSLNPSPSPSLTSCSSYTPTDHSLEDFENTDSSTENFNEFENSFLRKRCPSIHPHSFPLDSPQIMHHWNSLNQYNSSLAHTGASASLSTSSTITHSTVEGFNLPFDDTCRRHQSSQPNHIKPLINDVDNCENSKLNANKIDSTNCNITKNVLEQNKAKFQSTTSCDLAVPARTTNVASSPHTEHTLEFKDTLFTRSFDPISASQSSNLPHVPQQQSFRKNLHLNTSFNKSNITSSDINPNAQKSYYFSPGPNEEMIQNLSETFPTHYAPANGIRKSLFKLFSKVSCLSLSVLCVLTIALMLISSVSFNYKEHQDAASCRMSYMSPSYVLLDSFNQNYTRHHSKYSLYLYREKGIDDAFPNPTGIPVLFIPGNAGSFRQVRALAAKSATLFFSNPYKHPQFDYYTADFNEDLTAFHGRSLLDQAEYLNDAIKFILSLYSPIKNNTISNNEESIESTNDAEESFDENLENDENAQKLYPSPKSVILIGHSMGGVVARTMLMLENYNKGSVNTIFTLSAPHTLPPAPFDKELVSIYDSVNDFWERSFSQDFIGRNPLDQVSLVSITGGPIDTMITSESTSISSIVPPSNGFTVYTSSIPYVWGGIDHQAIVWCDQFRDVFAATLSEISDPRSSTKTKSLISRMKSFRSHFLGGFQSEASSEYLQTKYHPTLGGNTPPDSINNVNTKQKPISVFVPSSVGTHDTLLWVNDITKFNTPPGKQLIIRNLGRKNNENNFQDSSGRVYFMPISSDLISVPKNDLEFTLLTDQKLISYEDSMNKQKSTTFSSPDSEDFFHGSPDLETDKTTETVVPYNFKSGRVNHGLYAMACKYPHAEVRLSGTSLNVIDLTKGGFKDGTSEMNADISSHNAKSKAESKNGFEPINEEDDPKLVGLLCKNIAGDASILPNPYGKEKVHLSLKNERESHVIEQSEISGLSFIKYDATQLSDYDFITIIDTNPDPRPGFAIAEFSTKSGSRFNIDTNGRQLFPHVVSITLPPNRPFMVDISFEDIWSSLISYKITVIEHNLKHNGRSNQRRIQKIGENSEQLFQPFIRQYAGDSYESKYHFDLLPDKDFSTNTSNLLKHIPINFSAVAPFSPFAIRELDTDFEANLFYMGQKSHHYHNLHLQLWSDSSSNFISSSSSDYNTTLNTLEIQLKVDWLGSLGNLVMHYRIAVIAFPIAIISMVMFIQFRIYNNKGIFISCWDALKIFTSKYLVYFMLLSTVLPYCNLPIFRDLIYILEPGMDVYSGDGPASIFTNIRRNQFFLGLEPGHLLFLGPLFMVMATGLATTVYLLLYSIISMLSCIQWLFITYTSRIPFSTFRNENSLNLNQLENTNTPTALESIDKTSDASCSSYLLSPSPVSSPHFDTLSSIPRRRNSPTLNAIQSPSSKVSQSFSSSSTVNDNNKTLVLFPWGSARIQTIRKIVVTIFLFVAVAYTIPCEFAYLVACFVQLSTVIRAHYRIYYFDKYYYSKQQRTNKRNISQQSSHSNIEGSISPSSEWFINGNGEKVSLNCFFNFAMSTLLLMLFIVPVTAPILVVWGRKLTAHWNEAFQSHHNLLSIGPILFLVEIIASGKMIPRACSSGTSPVSKLGLNGSSLLNKTINTSETISDEASDNDLVLSIEDDKFPILDSTNLSSVLALGNETANVNSERLIDESITLITDTEESIKTASTGNATSDTATLNNNVLPKPEIPNHYDDEIIQGNTENNCKFQKLVTYCSLWFITFNAIVLGIPRTYVLYHLVNILSGWFLLQFFIYPSTNVNIDIHPNDETCDSADACSSFSHISSYKDGKLPPRNISENVKKMSKHSSTIIKKTKGFKRRRNTEVPVFQQMETYGSTHTIPRPLIQGVEYSIDTPGRPASSVQPLRTRSNILTKIGGIENVAFRTPNDLNDEDFSLPDGYYQGYYDDNES